MWSISGCGRVAANGRHNHGAIDVDSSGTVGSGDAAVEGREDRCHARSEPLKPVTVQPLVLQRIDFCCQNEVALGKADELVRPDRDFRTSPRKQNVGMMPLFFGESSNSVHEVKRLAKVGKREVPREMVYIDHLPLGHLLRERGQLLALARRYSAAAGNAGFGG